MRRDMIHHLKDTPSSSPRVQVSTWMRPCTDQERQSYVPEEAFEFLGSLRTVPASQAMETWMKSGICHVAYLHGPAASGKSRLLVDFADNLRKSGISVYLIDVAHPRIFSTPPRLWDLLQAFILSSRIAETPDIIIRAVQSDRAVLIIDNLDSYLLGSSWPEVRRLVKEIRDILPDRHGKLAQFPGSRGKILTALGNDDLELIISRAWSHGSPLAFFRMEPQRATVFNPTVVAEIRKQCGNMLHVLSYLAARFSMFSGDHWIKQRVFDLLGDEVSRMHFPDSDPEQTTQRVFEFCGPVEAPVLRFPRWLDRNDLHATMLIDALRTGNTNDWSIPQRIKPPLIERIATWIEAAHEPEKREMERGLKLLLREPMKRRSHHALRLAMEIHKMRPDGFVVRDANFSGIKLKGWRLSIPLPGANFSKANLGKVRFRSMDLSKANFSGCCLRDSWFMGCDVQNAIFDRADFGRRAVIYKCDFTGCSWAGVKGMSEENSFVCGILPETWLAARRDEAARFLSERSLLHASVEDSHWAGNCRSYPDEGLWLTYNWQGTDNPYSHRVDLWDSRDGRQLAAFDHGESISSADCAPQANRLFTASEYLLLVWDLRTGEVLGSWRTEYRIWRIRTDGTMVTATCIAPRGGTVEIQLKFEAGKFEKVGMVESEMTDEIFKGDYLLFNKELEPEDGMRRRLLVLDDAEHAVLVERERRWVVSRCSEGAFRFLCWAFLGEIPSVQNVVFFDKGRYRFHTAVDAGHPEDCGCTIPKLAPYRWEP